MQGLPEDDNVLPKHVAVIKFCTIVYVECASIYLFFNSPQWARDFSFTRVLHHTKRRTTVGRTPLDE